MSDRFDRLQKQLDRPGAVDRTRFTLNLPTEMLERMRDASWWTRRTLSVIVDEAMAEYLEHLEHEIGRKIPQRKGPLPRGRADLGGVDREMLREEIDSDG